VFYFLLTEKISEIERGKSYPLPNTDNGKRKTNYLK
jgi:hypothetical protein